jgi:hypothetical protein
MMRIARGFHDDLEMTGDGLMVAGKDFRDSFSTGMLRTFAALVALVALAVSTGCAPTVSRGGAGTKNPGLDKAALSTGLDKADLDYLVEENLNALFDSNFWQRSILDNPNDQPLVTIFPIRNDTSEHLDDQLKTLLSSIETFLVNSGSVGVVSRERQADMMREVGYQQGDNIDPSSAASVGRQLGAKYYFTGKLGAVDEKLKRERRVQYSLFLQVIEVDTSLIRFQNETARSKAIRK